MALYLHLGSAGAGKSHDLYEMISKEAAADFDRNFLLVVPEQFTLQTQRDMIAASPNGGIMNIDVLSFPRMAHRIFEELGVKTPVTLEDTGKTMIVKKVVLDRAGQLGIYSGKIHRQGFIQEMKSVIAEFYQYGIGVDELREMTELAASRPQLVNKLRDISIIYEGFREFISGRFMMNEELLELFIENAPRSKVLKGACICFDGFTGFTVMQLRCIECLMKLGCDIHVGLTIDARDVDKPASEEDLFCLSEKTIEKLVKLADSVGTETIRDIHNPKIPYRFRNSPALAALEHNLFRRGRTVCEEHEGISLLSCESPAAEIRSCICEIRRLIVMEGYRYNEIGVIVGDQATYGRIADREFTLAGMPYFLDSKKNIVGTAPIELLKAVLEIARSDFSYESVFRFLKTGITGVEAEDIYRTENFCLARAVRGKSMWNREWTGGYRTGYKVDIEAINATRAFVMELLGEPVDMLMRKDVTVAERISALRAVLEACKVKDKLEERAEAGRESKEYEERLEALENAQLFETLEAVFERIELLLGKDVISLSEFSEILNTGFSEAKLALIPQGGDSVVIGDMERTRFNSIKALFVLGCNEGMIPTIQGDGGILSNADRSMFAEHEIELSPTGRESAYLNEFYLYLNLTKPTDRLYLSYHRMTSDKKLGRPSYIYGRLLRMYKGLEIHNYYSGDKELLIGSDNGHRSTAALLRAQNPEGLSDSDKAILYETSMREPELYFKLVEAAFYRRLPEKITPENARRLYSETLTGSVTMLERYAACAFAHFINYGLCLEQRPEYTIGSLELGNIYHRALEFYCKALKKDKIAWHDTDAALRRKYEKDAVGAALGEYDELLKDSRRNQYISVRVERILNRTIDTLDAQVKAGNFEPEYFEQSFHHVGEFMKLDGKIDRMDIAEKNGRKYLRVVDYKSGSKNFDLLKLFYGLQIQLAVYMSEGVKEVSKAAEDIGFSGMYYYNIDDPIIETTASATDVGEKITHELRLKGPSLEGGDMLKLHDIGIADDFGDMSAGYTSTVIPVKVNKNKALDSGSKVYSEKQFDIIKGFVEQSMKNSCKNILDGNIDINPYEDGNFNACSYCKYNGICGFERKLGGKFRRLEKFAEDDIWLKLNGAANSEK